MVPNERENTVTIPKELYGKQVEVLVFERGEEKAFSSDTDNKLVKNFLDDIVSIPDFPSIDDIRKDAWPDKKW